MLFLKPMSTRYHGYNAGMRGEYSEIKFKVGHKFTSRCGSRC